MPHYPPFRNTTDPITTDGDTLTSYQQVEVVALGFRLSLHGLWIAQFTDQYNRVPNYVENSPYSFDEYEKLCSSIGTLTADYKNKVSLASQKQKKIKVQHDSIIGHHPEKFVHLSPPVDPGPT